ncbi:MAG: META domain-containing protein [Flavobacteriales bacterium]|nr:META domain-containing protein [Flavobacteriales bacterium]
MKRLFPFLLLISVVLISCKNKSQVSKSTEITSKTVVETVTEEHVIQEDVRIKSPIVNKYWKAIEIMGEKVVMLEEMKREPYLSLVEVGTVSGNTGCNQFFGKFTIQDNRFIQFKDIAMTEMDCSFKNYDVQFAEALSMARQFVVIGEDKMQLIVGKRAPLAIFQTVNKEQ